MITQTVHLLCGVPGSGKTWIAKQLGNKFSYVPHDEFPVAQYAGAIFDLARMSSRPILAECPFRMSVLIAELDHKGLLVYPYFIKEAESLIAQRYEAREGKPIPKQHLSNYRRLLNSERTWKVGSQSEIIAILKAV